MDILNCLQGLIIFLILVVFRKKALRALVKNRPWGFTCPKKWAAGVDEESERMLAEEEELSQTQTRTAWESQTVCANAAKHCSTNECESGISISCKEQ